MWIRSQDKTNLIYIKNVYIKSLDYIKKIYDMCFKGNEDVKQIKVKYLIITIIDKNEFVLGEYETEEKALKVLDLIQKYIGGMQDKKIIKEADDYYSITSKYDIPFVYCKDGIFQMPEDNKI